MSEATLTHDERVILRKLKATEGLDENAREWLLTWWCNYVDTDLDARSGALAELGEIVGAMILAAVRERGSK